MEDQERRNDSRNWNVDVLLDAGFARLPKSNVFERGHWVVLSPGISEGRNRRYLFDVRRVNLDKVHDTPRAAVLLRIDPAGFAFVPLRELESYLNPSTESFGPNSGSLYRFSCSIDHSLGTVTITSARDSAVSLTTALMSRCRVEEVLSGLE